MFSDVTLPFCVTYRPQASPAVNSVTNPFSTVRVTASLSYPPSETVIATGTPSGVGFVREPPEYLLPGDVVECEVAGVGVLRNSIANA